MLLVFKDRTDFDNFLLDKDRWVFVKSRDELSPEDVLFLNEISTQRSWDGRISQKNYERLQKMMERRRRSGQYGLLFADHLEHFTSYFDYKESIAPVGDTVAP